MTYVEEQLDSLNRRITQGREVLKTVDPKKKKRVLRYQTLLDIMIRRRRFLNAVMEERMKFPQTVYHVDKIFEVVAGTIELYFKVNEPQNGEHQSYCDHQHLVLDDQNYSEKINTQMEKFSVDYDYENIPMFLEDITKLQDLFAEFVIQTLEEIYSIAQSN